MSATHRTARLSHLPAGGLPLALLLVAASISCPVHAQDAQILVLPVVLPNPGDSPPIARVGMPVLTQTLERASVVSIVDKRELR